MLSKKVSSVLLVIVTILLLFAFIIAVGGCGAPQEQNEQKDKNKLTWKSQWKWGATNQTSSSYAYQVTAARIIQKFFPQVNITVVETGGSEDNLRRVARDKEFDLYMGNVDLAYEAVKGMGSFEKYPYDGHRFLWIISPNGRLIVSRKDAGITTLSDLEGKGFFPGPAGSAATSDVERIIEALDIKPKWYRGGGEDGLAAMKNRQIEAYAKSSSILGLDATFKDIMHSMEVNWVSITPEQEKKVMDKYPWWSFGTIPAGTLDKAQPEIRIRTSGFGVFATKDMPEDVAYNITKAVLENASELRAAYNGVPDDIAKATLEVTGLTPLHPGAIRYYRELGLKVPEGAIPPEMKK